MTKNWWEYDQKFFTMTNLIFYKKTDTWSSSNIKVHHCHGLHRGLYGRASNIEWMNECMKVIKLAYTQIWGQSMNKANDLCQPSVVWSNSLGHLDSVKWITLQKTRRLKCQKISILNANFMAFNMPKCKGVDDHLFYSLFPF